MALLLMTSRAMAEKRILIIGDSLTAGYGVSAEAAFPNQLELLLKAKRPGVQVIAAGSRGSTSASASSRLAWHLKKKPDMLILALGANDGLRGLPVESTRENLGKAIDKAKAEGIVTLLAGMKMPSNYGEEYREKYEALFSELAKEKEIPFIPFLLEGVGAVSEMNLADGIHPNEQGHRKIAETLLKTVEEHL